MAKNDGYSSDKETELFRFSDRKKNKQEQQRCCQIQHKMFKTEWEGLFPVSLILSDLYSFLCVACHKHVQAIIKD